MANRRTQGAVIGVLWLVALAALAVITVLMGDHAYFRRQGFPYMPRYGAVIWWFFFVIPLIGATWGFFNDWKEKHKD